MFGKSDLLKKYYKNLCTVILKYPYKAFFFSFSVSIFLLYYALQIKLDPSLNALLPKDHLIFTNLNKAEKLFGHRDTLDVIIRSNSFEEGVEFVQKVAYKIEKLPELEWVMYRAPVDFFKEHALFYLEMEDLNKIYGRLKNKIEYEKRKSRMSLLMDLDEPDPGFQYEDIRNKYKSKLIFGNWEKKYTTDFLYTTVLKNGKEEHIFMLLAKPLEPSWNVAYANNIIHKVNTILQEHKPKYEQISKIEFTGRYKKKSESFNDLGENFKLVTSISGIGILLILLFYFRTLWPILLLITGLLNGIIMTIGIAQMIFGTLNLVSTFLIAILFGLGIDFGIHILLRYKEERSQGKSIEEAFQLMYTETCIASSSAVVTTIFAFLGLMFSNFAGFSTFGIIASIGMACTLFSYMIFMPSLILILAKGLKIRIIVSNFNIQLPSLNIKRANLLVIFAVLFSLLCVYKSQFRIFDTDFSKVMGNENLPSYKLDLEVKSLFNESFVVPSIIFTENPENESKILEVVNKEIKENKPENCLRNALGIQSFVPPDQKKKKRTMNKIKSLVDRNRKYLPLLVTKDKMALKDFRKQLNAQPFSRDQIPEYIRKRFIGKEGYENQSMVLVYPKVKLEDGDEVLRLADQLEKLRIDEKPIQFAFFALILAEVVRIIRSDSFWIFLINFVLVYSIVVINFKSFFKALLVLMPVSISILWILGIQGMIGLKSDPVNTIIYPIIIGIGIDSGIHMYYRFLETKSVEKAVRYTGEAITLSSLTTLVGFGALFFASNQGISNMGSLAMIGILGNFVASIIVLPSILLILLPKFKKRLFR